MCESTTACSGVNAVMHPLDQEAHVVAGILTTGGHGPPAPVPTAALMDPCDGKAQAWSRSSAKPRYPLKLVMLSSICRCVYIRPPRPPILDLPEYLCVLRSLVGMQHCVHLKQDHASGPCYAGTTSPLICSDFFYAGSGSVALRG